MCLGEREAGDHIDKVLYGTVYKSFVSYMLLLGITAPKIIITEADV